jgi:hypothetical protein
VGENARGPYSVQTRAETAELNLLLREWLGLVRIHDTLPETVITAWRRSPLSASKAPAPNTVRLPRREWARASCAVGRRYRRPAAWTDQEIVAALQEWVAEHGCAPNSSEWIAGGVRRRFGGWEKALKRAGLKPNARRHHCYWTEQEILDALNAWMLRNGRPPMSKAGTWACRLAWCNASLSRRPSRQMFMITYAGSRSSASAVSGGSEDRKWTAESTESASESQLEPVLPDLRIACKAACFG